MAAASWARACGGSAPASPIPAVGSPAYHPHPHPACPRPPGVEAVGAAPGQPAPLFHHRQRPRRLSAGAHTFAGQRAQQRRAHQHGNRVGVVAQRARGVGCVLRAGRGCGWHVGSERSSSKQGTVERRALPVILCRAPVPCTGPLRTLPASPWKPSCHAHALPCRAHERPDPRRRPAGRGGQRRRPGGPALPWLRLPLHIGALYMFLHARWADEAAARQASGRESSRHGCRCTCASHSFRPLQLARTASRPQALASFIIIQAALKRSQKLKKFSARWVAAGAAWGAAAAAAAACGAAPSSSAADAAHVPPAALPPWPGHPHAQQAHAPPCPPALPGCRPDLNARMPGYQVNMGFGLHVGE